MNKYLTYSLLFSIILSGCATNFSNPIGPGRYGKPTIRIIQQGSVPMSVVYREKFYIINTNIQSKAFLTPDIVGQMVSQGLTAISDISSKSSEKYYDAVKSIYRWRTDIIISGFTNLSEKEIISILENGTRPQFDAQRAPVIYQ